MFWGFNCLSIFGSPEAAEFWKTATSPVVLVSEIAIHKKFDAQIEVENLEIEKGENMRYAGAITEHGSKRITQAKAAKKVIEANRQAEIKEARRKNKIAQDKYDAKTANAGTWFQSFAGIGEGIAIIILLFCANFDKGIEIEILSRVENQNHQNSHQGFTPTPALAAPNQMETLQQAFELFGKMQAFQQSNTPVVATHLSHASTIAPDRRLIRFQHTDREVSTTKLPNSSHVTTQNNPNTQQPSNKADRTDKDRNRELVKTMYDKLNSEGKKPSQQRIAELTGLSRKTVGKHLRYLQQTKGQEN